MDTVDKATSLSAWRSSPPKCGVAALLVGFLSLTGCRASPPEGSDAPARVMVDAGGVPIPPSHSGPPRLLKTSELSDAEKRFGISPERTPGLTYQPDVVLLRAGVNAIRSLSDDGLVWTLDPRAEGIDGIQPGKVLLLSTKAAGKVLAVNRTNAGVDVVLGPADITEIVREGSFSIDQPVDLTQALQMALPASFDPVRPVAPISASALRPDTFGAIMRPVRFAPLAEEHDFRVIPMASVKGVGAELRSKPGGVLMVAQIVFRLEAPNLNVKLNIQPSGVKSALVELKGAAGIEASFEAASPGPNARNINADRPAPIDLFIPINGLGVPFAVHVRQAFRLQTAFASTGTVKAHGFYELSGGIRAEYSGGKFSVDGPKGLGKTEILLPNLNGAVFGPAGIVFTHQVNIMVGVGVAGFVAGPYVYDNTSITAAKGSALSRPLTPECRRETVVMAVGAGVGYRIPAVVAKVINSILNFFKITAQIKDSGGVSTNPVTLVNTGWYWPKMQDCGG